MIKVPVKNKRHIVGAIGLATVIAAAASMYFLYGKNGAQRRKKVRGWAVKVKKEVIEQLKNLKEFNQAAYNRVIDNVGNRYKQLKSIDPAEIRKVMGELKSHWKNIRLQLRPASSKRKRDRKK